MNGATPLPLSSGKVEYFSAAFYLRNPLVGGLRQDQVSITRERFVGEGMQDVVVLENQSMDPVSLELGLEFEADFASILAVKEHDFALGDPMRAQPLPDPAPNSFDTEHNQFVFVDGEDSLRTQIILSRSGSVDGFRADAIKLTKKVAYGALLPGDWPRAVDAVVRSLGGQLDSPPAPADVVAHVPGLT